MTPARKLKEFKELMPNAFRYMQQCLDSKGTMLPSWPDWCLVPMAGAYAAITEGRTVSCFDDVAKVQECAALFAWEKTKGVYIFDKDIEAEILNTPLKGLPSEVLFQLPEWCIYIQINKNDISGVFVHLEFDINTNKSELRLLFLFLDGNTYGYPVLLESKTLQESINALQGSLRLDIIATFGAALSRTLKEGKTLPELPEKILEEVIKMTVYICSDEADIIKKDSTSNKKILRINPINPVEWSVGERIGAALRRYKYEYENNGDGSSTGQRKRPHIRKAHWHNFRTGTGKKNLVCKWLPPVPVGWAWDDELPVVNRPVK